MQSDPSKKSTLLLILTLAAVCVVLIVSFKPIFAQQTQPVPIYIIQPGETLTDIAARFGIELNDLITANGIINADLITPGTRIIIPGFEGVSGILTTKIVGLAESLDFFAEKEKVSLGNIVTLNRLTSPNEVYAGSNLVIPVSEIKNNNEVVYLPSGQTDIEFSLLSDLSTWDLVDVSTSGKNRRLISSDVLSVNSDAFQTLIQLGLVKLFSISPLPLKQGSTHVIQVKSHSNAVISGTLGESDLLFYSYDDKYAAIQGIYALAEPGLIRFSIAINNIDSTIEILDQMVLLESGGFISDPPIQVADQTIDPAFTQPENDFVSNIVNQVSNEKLWDGKFIYPVDEPIGFMSIFGSRRSYNNGGLLSFHTGLDFGVYANSLNIYAAASGRVAFAGPLTVRGNSIFIDHGRGIFSGYFHQSELKVKEGEFVFQGQLIGLIGATGRVTGPHLHWEIWANGYQVNPIDWVKTSFP